MDKKRSPAPISRRDFMMASAFVGAGGLLTTFPVSEKNRSSDEKKRYVIVGTGVRSRMYQDAIEKIYKKYGSLVGLCDINPGRVKLAQSRSLKNSGIQPAGYDAADFTRMIQENKADTVIVTTVDGFHHEYIIKGMELGCDIITEKPMTIDGDKCQAIIDCQRKTGKKCTVTFNYRYSPPRTQVKDILMSGVIGEVLSVDFHWMLNTHHGADYFRRWHSQKMLSGGLMVHKATHHFDLVNWWLSAIPVSVYATGKREFYVPAMAKRFGLNTHHDRCFTCPEKSSCGFELDLTTSPALKELYLSNEKYDGYFRDRCVFRPDIDIEDTMNVLVTYDNNITLCYSLNAFNSWEGYAVVFNGTKGRLEHTVQESIYVSGTNSVQGELRSGGITTSVIPLRGPKKEMDPWTGIGGHGGGDQLLLDDIFLPQKREDRYLRAADQRSGACSILIGAAANISMRSGQAVVITDLVDNVGFPNYPEMPSRKASLPMPQKR